MLKRLSLHAFVIFLLSFSLLAEEVKNYGLNASATFISNLYKADDYRQAASTQYSIGGSYTLNENHAFTLGFQGVKKLTGDFRAENEAFVLGHSQKLGTYKDAVFSAGQSAAVPVNKAARRDQTLNFSLAANVAVSKPVNLFVPAGLSLALIAKKNFHGFETNANRKFNASYVVTIAPSISLNLTDKFGYSFAAALIESFDYAGGRSENYSFDNSLSYSVSDAFNVSTGVSIGGATFIARGNDNNIQLFDTDDSEVYFSSSYSF